jgi:hypothetical protein
MLNRTNGPFALPAGRQNSVFASERARRAVDVALRFLREREQNERVRALAMRAEALRSEIEGWRSQPPSTAAREGVMQRALSIHLEAVALTRKT